MICAEHRRGADVWPVRIAAGAFGEGLPGRDLYLSPDHAVFADGVLVPIRYLVNGTTIAREAAGRVTWYHVELADAEGGAAHDVLLAEGLPSESFLDTGNRGAFANGGGAIDLHPDFARAVWQRLGCAPLLGRPLGGRALFVLVPALLLGPLGLAGRVLGSLRGNEGGRARTRE